MRNLFTTVIALCVVVATIAQEMPKMMQKVVAFCIISI